MLAEKQDAEVSRLRNRTRRVSRICLFPNFIALILQYDVQRVKDARNVAWRRELLITKGHANLASSDACGNVPRQVRRMFINRSAPQPRSKKTPSGGRIMAKMILMMSLRWQISTAFRGEVE